MKKQSKAQSNLISQAELQSIVDRDRQLGIQILALRRRLRDGSALAPGELTHRRQSNSEMIAATRNFVGISSLGISIDSSRNGLFRIYPSDLKAAVTQRRPRI